MTQRDLNRAVARATGESVDTIEQMGFGPLGDSDDGGSGDNPEPNTIDWDANDDARLEMRSVRRQRLVASALNFKSWPVVSREDLWFQFFAARPDFSF